MTKVEDQALATLFTDARTQNAWLPTEVSDDTLRQLYDLVKFGPTSANSSPARFIFCKSEAARAKLAACAGEKNSASTPLHIDETRPRASGACFRNRAVSLSVAKKECADRAAT